MAYSSTFPPPSIQIPAYCPPQAVATQDPSLCIVTGPPIYHEEGQIFGLYSTIVGIFGTIGMIALLVKTHKVDVSPQIIGEDSK
jgi:hypothetical protein